MESISKRHSTLLNGLWRDQNLTAVGGASQRAAECQNHVIDDYFDSIRTLIAASLIVRASRVSYFPHHKHVNAESNVVSAAPPDLATVLKEIESIIAL